MSASVDLRLGPALAFVFIERRPIDVGRLEGGGGVVVERRRRFSGGPRELLGLPNILCCSSRGDSCMIVSVRSMRVSMGFGPGMLSPDWLSTKSNFISNITSLFEAMTYC